MKHAREDRSMAPSYRDVSHFLLYNNEENITILTTGGNDRNLMKRASEDRSMAPSYRDVSHFLLSDASLHLSTQMAASVDFTSLSLKMYENLNEINFRTSSTEMG